MTDGHTCKLCADDATRRGLDAEIARLRSDNARLQQELENEIHDVHMIARHCAIAYDHMTNGRISKPTTVPDEVIRVAEDVQKRTG